MPSREDSTARSSSDYEEKHGLLEGVVSSPLAGASPRMRWAVILLALSNAVSLCALFYAAVRPQPVPTTVVYPPQPDWFPPQSMLFYIGLFFFLAFSSIVLMVTK